MSTRLFTEERDVILDPLKAHRCRLIKDKEEFEPMTRASEIMLTAEEPSIRTYFCAKSVVTDYIRNHPNDPRGYKELGKVHLYSCVPENIDLAEEAFKKVQSLSGNIDAEGWYLWSMCHRIRMFGCGSTSQRSDESKTLNLQNGKRYLRLTEKGLKLALKHSNGSNVYRFALSDFYSSTNRLSKALSTLQSGISASQQTQVDAAIFHQLGRFGISCINGLQERGRQDGAKEVGMGALQYYRQAIEIGGNDTEEWKAELANAELIVDQLVEQTSDLADFSTEPDFNPSGPISLKRWLTASPVSTQQGDDSLSPEEADVSGRLSDPISKESAANLTEFLDRIENQAQTYQNGDPDGLIENFRWPHPPSRLGEPRLPSHQPGPSMNPCRRNWGDSVGPTSFLSGPCHLAERKSNNRPLPDSYNLTSRYTVDEFDEDELIPSPLVKYRVKS
ncbi:uncharacterized protein PGTG_07518 [Puccinia graminis f. sp. tritici CRL 75-36-700-3]|uniref:Uncharacterized protein n=1 Tax=Puccinia graminis f. sp. tritici (strain CRL 75-36-700-3 / race SCCL) TaxID=418459 RepID=E3KDA6_PUCGT|nr:uncharacterized protein PGTG_07518 [Puccinia graminis f. sp. tritici CRL 75-36-700-3]EFP82121.2 hypothetical protein PGTG_07518 [Puccinia graminis f. sp. tritici CRL 75-36-700-3]